MIPIKNFIQDALKNMNKLNLGNCIEMKTYKRDRGVTIEKTAEGFNVYEYGYNKEKYSNLCRDEVEKLLQIIKGREFPRSNMVRVSILNKINYNSIN